jgi:hypothetical protein
MSGKCNAPQGRAHARTEMELPCHPFENVRQFVYGLSEGVGGNTSSKISSKNLLKV